MTTPPGRPLDDADRLAALTATGTAAVPDEVLDRFTRLVQKTLRVPVSLVSLVDGSRQFFPGAAGLRDPWARSRQTPLTHSFCQVVVTSAAPLVVTDAREDARVRDNPAIADLDVIGYAGMPLTDDGGLVLGSLCAIDHERREWTAEELGILGDLAAACSSELRLRIAAAEAVRAAEVGRQLEAERSRLAAQVDAALRDSQLLLRERMTVAETLQRAMLSRLPEPDHLHLVARYESASTGDQVGGDWYDAFALPGGDTTLVIGDVVGHDMAAAAIMGQLRSILRAYGIDREEPPSALLNRLDHANNFLNINTTLTAIVARISQTADDRDRDLRRLHWSNAGHPPPILLYPDGRVESLPGRDALLGTRMEINRCDHSRELGAGCTVLLHTDGLVESRGHSIDDRTDKLHALLRDLADTPLPELLDVVIDRMAGAHPEDDIAVLACRVHPEDRPRPAEAGREAPETQS